MSIRISKESCKQCGLCSAVCPGALIVPDKEGYAQIDEPNKCWGCTACMKTCPYGAIALTLNSEASSTKLYAENEAETIKWTFIESNKEIEQITTHKKESNKY